MRPRGRGPILLLAVIMAALAGGGALLWSSRGQSSGASGGAAPVPAAQTASEAATAASAAPAAAPSGMPSTPPPPAPRLPDSPLPAPAVAEGNAEEQAAILARQVLAGGDAAVPALVGALLHAGFPIRNADGSVIPPARGSQGIAFEAWEVNLLAGMASRREALTAPLSSIAGALAAPLPNLTGEAVANGLLAGIRRRARDVDGPLLFWSAFITELGRNAIAHPRYDLLGDIDPATTPLDAIQLALIGKRLAADAAVLAYPERVKAAAGLPQLPSPWLAWLVQPVHAQSPPCTFKDGEAEVMDWTALGSTTAFGWVTEYLGSRDVAGAGTANKAAAYLGVVLAYVKVALTQWAFEIRFELDQPPLVRTTKVRPQYGEQRTLTTTVSMDFGKLQWINCFRIMLNAVGLDLNVDDDGPVDDAEVSWNGLAGFRHPWAVGAGPEYLVRFAGGSGGQVLNQKTDKQGQARILVEGVGQEESVGSEPTPVMKEATAVAMVVLKPANLFRDLKDAGATALGGLQGLLAMPAELLYRTRWTFGGTYVFPIKDWKIGQGWSGSVSYRRIERRFNERKSDRICCGGRTMIMESSDEMNEVWQGTWEIAEDADSQALTPDFSMASASYTLTAERSRRERSFHTGWASCRGGAHPQTSTLNEREERASASYSGKVEVTVQLEADGSFLIQAGAAEEQVAGELRITGRGERNDGCRGTTPTRATNHTGKYRLGSHDASISGKVDDPNTNVLKGSLTRVERQPSIGTTRTHIYEWDVRR